MLRHLRNRMIFVALAALAVGQLSVAAQASVPSGARAEDDAAIRENVRQMEAGWNAKSGEQFAKPFAEDADYVVINGRHIRGRDAIGKGHQQIFDTFMKGTTMSFSVKQTRYVRPDVAVVHVGAHLKQSPTAGGGAQEADASITLVMSKEKSGWQIVAFQNTQVEDRH